MILSLAVYFRLSSCTHLDACFTIILKSALAGSLFYRCVSMIGFCAWIKGYCGFSACKLGWFSRICIHHAKNWGQRHSRNVQILVYLSSGLVNNKDADQPTHSHGLISAFVFRSFESIISRLSVAKETGLSLFFLSKAPKTGLFCVEAQIHYSLFMLLFLFTTAFSFGCLKKLLTCFRLRIVGAAKSIQEQIKC